MKKIKKLFFLFVIFFNYAHASSRMLPEEISNTEHIFIKKLLLSAEEQTRQKVKYDGSYSIIAYPNGDVPTNIGVCTDVIIRAYRQLGFDLQQLVHEDMKKNFDLYPKLWALTKPDTNIDHRRVPNLMVFLARFGQILPITNNIDDYKPGDLVTWNIGSFWRLRKNIPHIGIISNKKTRDGKCYLIIHNIGFGPQLENSLFSYPITGHYRYLPIKFSEKNLTAPGFMAPEIKNIK